MVSELLVFWMCNVSIIIKLEVPLKYDLIQSKSDAKDFITVIPRLTKLIRSAGHFRIAGKFINPRIKYKLEKNILKRYELSVKSASHYNFSGKKSYRNKNRCTKYIS